MPLNKETKPKIFTANICEYCSLIRYIYIYIYIYICVCVRRGITKREKVSKSSSDIFVEGSYRSWDLYTTGQQVDGLQQKKKTGFH